METCTLSEELSVAVEGPTWMTVEGELADVEEALEELRVEGE